MRLKVMGLCGLFVTLITFVPLHSAGAGDRKDVAAAGLRSDSRFSDFVTNSDSKFSRLHPDAVTKEKDSGPKPLEQRKKLVLFRLNPKFGDITVQPVIGKITGAQLCVGF